MNRAYLTNPDRWNPDIEATRERLNARFCEQVTPRRADEETDARPILWIAVFAALLIGLSLVASIH